MHTRSIASNEQIGTLDNSPFLSMVSVSEKCKTSDSCFYRPQRSWGKVMFLQASVILLTGGVSAPPTEQTHTDTHTHTHPGSRPPQEQTPREQTPPPPEQSMLGDTVNLVIQ